METVEKLALIIGSHTRKKSLNSLGAKCSRGRILLSVMARFISLR